MSTELSEQEAQRASSQLLQMLSGFWVSQILHVLAALGVADCLRDGPIPVHKIAAAVGAHEESLYRVLRASSAVGVFRETLPKVFALTPPAQLLCSDAPHSLHAVATMLGRENYTAWGRLLSSVRSGTSAFPLAYGREAHAYFSEHPEAAGIFHTAMAALAGWDAEASLSSYDFSPFLKIVDVGGGQGILLSAILQRCPGIRAVLFDLPGVISQAEPLLRAEIPPERLLPVPGDFFQSVPCGGDLYLLSRILHGFDDTSCGRILRNVHAAMPLGARLLIMEDPLNEDDSPASAPVKLMDVNMLVFTPGGRERTLEEYRCLLQSSGFEPARIFPTAGSLTLIESVKI